MLCLDGRLTDCDMIRSMTIWEVSEEAKEKGFPETVAEASSASPAMSSGMATTAAPLERVTLESAGERAGVKWVGSPGLGLGFVHSERERERKLK